MDIQLQPKKLGFFQNIRKNFYLRNMSEEKAGKYKDLPQYLREDIDVIDAVVEASPTFIESVPFGSKLRLVRENPQLLDSIGNFETKAELIEATPELARYLSENDICNLVYEKQLFEIVKDLPAQMQEKMISGSVGYKSYSRGLEVIGESLPVEFFSEATIKEFAKEHKIEMNLKQLSPRLQIELLKISNEYYSKLSPEVLEEFVGDNPLLFELLPEEVKNEKISQNPDMLKRLDNNTAVEYQTSLNISHKNRNHYNNLTFDISEYSTSEEAKSQLIKWGAKWKDITIEPSKIDNDFIWEMAQFNPNCINESYNEVKVIETLYQHAKEYQSDGEITSWIYQTSNLQLLERTKNIPVEVRKTLAGRQWILQAIRNGNLDAVRESLSPELFERITQNKELNALLKDEIPTEEIQSIFENKESSDKKQKFNSLTKLLSNDDIMKRVSQEEIMDYINNPSHKKLVNIVKKTYGEKSAQILIDRPQMRMDIIPNMYIFHPEIIEEFSIGAVHATLTYETALASEFSEFARDPEKMDQYRKFSELTRGKFKDTAVDLERKIIAFEHSIELLSEIDIKELTDEQKENLYLAIDDLAVKKEQIILSFPRNIEELNRYEEGRTRIYDDAITKLSSINDKKQVFCQKYFGMDYIKEENPNTYKSTNPETIKNMCEFYQLGKFVKDSRTINSGRFSEEDMYMLQALNTIHSTNDTKVLDSLSEHFGQNKATINIERCHELRDKVRNQYSQEFVDNLMSPQKAEEMIQQGVEGISMREEDGIKIITFEGAEFFAYVTNPNLNNASLRDVEELPEKLVETWKNYENGISTSSGTIVNTNGENAVFTKDNCIGFGLSNVNPNQIELMNASDAHTSHDRQQLQPTAQRNKI